MSRRVATIPENMASRSLFLLLIGVTANIYAQTGNVAGTVSESLRKGLVTGAEVTVEDSALRTVTDDSGRYTLLGLPSGKVRITVSYLGMEPATQAVTVTAGATVAIDFTLSPSVKTSITV